ncbi:MULTISPECIES: hypothetical protein [unclassified Oceanobacillus]|uniref:hypothetical protein n=1 Tax=unclassified Oceanobacillus TaxID=2630292 RepID=UPI0012EBB3C0|nr:hypothetical protein [Oceanobacillus sp. AG]
MAQPRFVVNRMGRTINVYNYSGNIGGRILNNECYVTRGDIDGTWSTDIYYYNAAAGGWKTGQVSYEDTSANNAYSIANAEATSSSGATFLIRSGRRCRIYQGTIWIDSIYGANGDRINTSGLSYAGMTYPDRLSIRSYRKNGQWFVKSNLWCDTDILFGYPTVPTVYSSKMP